LLIPQKAKEEEERKERQERIEQLEMQKQEIQSQYRKKHPPHTHIYKKPSRESIKQETELKLDDCLFLVKSTGRADNRPTRGVDKKENNTETAKVLPVADPGFLKGFYFGSL